MPIKYSPIEKLFLRNGSNIFLNLNINARVMKNVGKSTMKH